MLLALSGQIVTIATGWSFAMMTCWWTETPKFCGIPDDGDWQTYRSFLGGSRDTYRQSERSSNASMTRLKALTVPAELQSAPRNDTGTTKVYFLFLHCRDADVSAKKWMAWMTLRCRIRKVRHAQSQMSRFRSQRVHNE